MPRLRSLLATWLLVLGASCAAPSSEINLAPLYLRATAPGIQRTEVLGGLARFEESPEWRRWALNPLLWRERRADGSVQADFALLLGRYEHSPDRNRTQTRFLPFFLYETERRPDGVQDTDWMVLPFFLGGSSSDGEEDYFAFFPFYGNMKGFLAWEEVRFVLFPFFARTKKLTGTQTTHWLWPFFGYSEGRGEGWHFWPFYGRWQVPGREQSRYILWPFWNDSVTDQHLAYPRKSWFFFPFMGRIDQGDYSATTLAWPFLGRAERPSTNYYAWSFWPFLKFEEGGTAGFGKENPRELKRVLPFYIHFEDEDTEFQSYLFPFFWKRKDDFGGMQRDGYYALPFWWTLTTKRYDDLDGDGVDEHVATEKISRLWPFAAWKTVVDESTGRGLDQNEGPYFGEVIARNLTRPLAIWQRNKMHEHGPILERAFLGLYHSLESAGHRRWSVPIVGGRWTEPDGTRHHSYLFGLIRWSTGNSGSGWETPAFPGPGWPELHRLPAAGRTTQP